MNQFVSQYCLGETNEWKDQKSVSLYILELKNMPQHTHFQSEKLEQALMLNYLSLLLSHFLFNQDSWGEDSLN